MKLYFTLTLFICATFTGFAQSITIDPNSLQLPKVAVNPACTVADKGKLIYNNVQNKLLYCNGSAWINPETGTAFTPTPAYQAKNSVGITLTSSMTVVPFINEYFDIGNHFALTNEGENPNTFVAPYKGIYGFLFQAKINLLDNFTPNNTRIVIAFSNTFTGGTDNLTYNIPVNANADEQVISIPIVAQIYDTSKVKLLAYIANKPAFGLISLQGLNFNGYLITRN